MFIFESCRCLRYKTETMNVNEISLPMQGPLKKWTEHSLELHLLQINSRGAPITPQGWMGVDFLEH